MNFLYQTGYTINFSIIKITDDEAKDKVNLIAVKEGLFVGNSSGAAIAAALKLVKTVDKGNIVISYLIEGIDILAKTSMINSGYLFIR